MKKESLLNASIIIMGILALIALLLIFLRVLLPPLLPFLIAWVVALAVRGPSRAVSRRLHLPERAVRPILGMLVALLIFCAVGVLIWQLTGVVWKSLGDIGEGNNAVYDFIFTLLNSEFLIFGSDTPPELSARISQAIGDAAVSILTEIGAAVTSWIGEIPGILVFLLVTVISLIYFSIDIDKINARVRRLLPKRVADGLGGVADRFFSVIRKYAGSYALLFAITFAVVLCGLLIMRVRGALLLTFIIALLDILPIVGVGTVLIPWSIFSFATREVGMGIGLIVLFVVNAVIRQLAEPRIIGKNLGIHPLLTLAMIYVGYSLLGLWGLVAIPVAVAIFGIGSSRDGKARGDNDTRPPVNQGK